MKRQVIQKNIQLATEAGLSPAADGARNRRIGQKSSFRQKRVGEFPNLPELGGVFVGSRMR